MDVDHTQTQVYLQPLHVICDQLQIDTIFLLLISMVFSNRARIYVRPL
jgi:hypothetical protein